MDYTVRNSTDFFTSNYVHRLLPMPHLHSQLELVYLEEGICDVTVDNQKLTINSGELLIVFPNQIHYYEHSKRLRAYLVIFSMNLFEDMKEIFQHKLPQNPILPDNSLPSNILENLKYLNKNLQSTKPFNELIAKGCLLSILGEVLPNMNLKEAASSQDSVHRILTYCSENYLQPITLDTLSKELYLNKYYISHVFQERLQMHYRDFINTLRVDHACRLLTKNANITEIAFESGFSSIRTFNRAFAKHTGRTPREYIKEELNT